MSFKKILSEMSGNIDKQLALTILPLINNSKVMFIINGISFEIAQGSSENIKKLINNNKTINVDTDTKGLVKIFLETK